MIILDEVGPVPDDKKLEKLRKKFCAALMEKGTVIVCGDGKKGIRFIDHKKFFKEPEAIR